MLYRIVERLFDFGIDIIAIQAYNALMYSVSQN
jgi:hypothetical protein